MMWRFYIYDFGYYVSDVMFQINIDYYNFIILLKMKFSNKIIVGLYKKKFRIIKKNLIRPKRRPLEWFYKWNKRINLWRKTCMLATRRHLTEEEAELRILEDYAGEVTGGNARYRGETAFAHFKRF